MTGATLRARRKALGYGQQQLADRLDTTRNTISRWEGDVLRIDRPKMLDLALRALEAEKRDGG